MRRRARLLAVPAVLGALALSACGPNQLGAAAVVNDQRITISEVQGALDDVRDERTALGLDADLGADAAQQEVLRRVLALVFEQAARDLNVTVTPGDVAAARDSDERTAAEIAQVAAENNVSLESLDDLFRQATIEQKIVEQLERRNPTASEDELSTAYSEQLVATAKRMDIRVNPRYGTFNPDEGTIVPTDPDFIRTGTS